MDSHCSKALSKKKGSETAKLGMHKMEYMAHILWFGKDDEMERLV
jgi:hypothetical protein